MTPESENVVRTWLAQPWTGMADQCTQIGRAQMEFLPEDAVVSLAPKGQIKPSEIAAVSLGDACARVMCFGEIDMAGAQGFGKSFFREIWLFDVEEAQDWLDALTSMIGAASHFGQEVNTTDMKAWVWLDKSDPRHIVRLTYFPATKGAKVSQLGPIAERPN